MNKSWNSAQGKTDANESEIPWRQILQDTQALDREEGSQKGGQNKKCDVASGRPAWGEEDSAQAAAWKETKQTGPLLGRSQVSGKNTGLS